MPTNAYDRLSFLDNSFLMMETPTSPMHVAGTATFEAGPHRRLNWLTMDLDTVKGVKKRLGGTLNDVVLATVAGVTPSLASHALSLLHEIAQKA